MPANIRHELDYILGLTSREPSLAMWRCLDNPLIEWFVTLGCSRPAKNKENYKSNVFHLSRSNFRFVRIQ
jgi:hypothetical protein